MHGGALARGMRSKARLLGHPLHPMLVMFPVAVFPLLLFFDVLQAWLGVEELWTAGFWLAVAGAVVALAAVVPGTMDMARIPDGTKAHRVGIYHAVVGTLILVLLAVAAWVRWGAAPADRFGWALGVDVLGTLLVTVQGWLGGELVYRHHVGVNEAGEGGEPVEADSPGAGGAARRGPRRVP